METDFTELKEVALNSCPQSLKCKLAERFINLYGKSSKEIQFFQAPARINIIGEHIDYNGGLVFPAAIDKCIYLAIRLRDDSTINYDDIRFPGRFSFDITENFVYKKENGYCNYLNGIITILKSRGHEFPCGFDALFFSCIPDGGGVSSSSAMECCFTAGLSKVYALGIDSIQNAKIGQETEHRFMNVQCGIMDQFIIAMGRKDHAILLDCATLDYRYVPLKLGDYRFVVMNTNKKRQLSDSKYNERVAECKQGLEALNQQLEKHGIQKLSNPCSATEQHLEILRQALDNQTIYRRLRHCITENRRVNLAVQAMGKEDLVQLGKLMNESHQSLRDDYETTGIELDTLHEQANNVDGCLGARVTGAGFGGCAIALVHKDKCAVLMENVGKVYREKIGYNATFFECTTGNGAGIL